MPMAERQRRRAERDLREATERSLVAQRGATTRARRQRDKARQSAANGQCPCCGRTFADLARHMAAKHPEHGPLGEHNEGEGMT